MFPTERVPDILEGLRKDPQTGHYRVLPGYAIQANRYRIHETWLDEDDGLWIEGAAVERERARSEARAGAGVHGGGSPH